MLWRGHFSNDENLGGETRTYLFLNATELSKFATDFFLHNLVTAQLREQSFGSENPPPFPHLAPIDPDCVAADAIDSADQHLALCFRRSVQHSLARTRSSQRVSAGCKVRSCFHRVFSDHHILGIPVADRDRPEIHRLRIACRLWSESA